MIKRSIYILLMVSMFIGCGSGSGGGDSVPLVIATNEIPIEIASKGEVEVEIFTTSPILNAIVKDANNQVALYDSTQKKYKFTHAVVYPITAEANTNTFVDIDYNGNKTAIDIVPKFTKLKSFCNKINLLTTLYYTSHYQDNNIKESEYREELANNYNISDVCNNEEVAKVSFALSNYMFIEGLSTPFDLLTSKNIVITSSDMTKEIGKINDFYNNDLKGIVDISDENTKTKYYSLYNAFINLDKKIFSRVDSLHIPSIPILLRSKLIVENNNTTIGSVLDIKIINSVVYTALGQDILNSLSITLLNENDIINTPNPPVNSFGKNIYHQNYNNTDCLFLANGLAGIASYDLTTPPAVFKEDTLFYDKQGEKVDFTTSGGILNINGYVSSAEVKRLLAISTEDKGFYLVNIKDTMKKCTKTKDIKTADFLIENKSGKSISSAFRRDGTYLYITNENKIRGYNITSLDKADIETSKIDFSPSKEDVEYYNLLLQNSDDHLFSTTNKGIEIYDVSSGDKLQFISAYHSEGAKTGYLSKIKKINNFLIFTDAEYGVKILKLDTNFNPQLCGVAYFSSLGNPKELARVTSLEYNNGKLYVGISSYGIKKIDFNSLLFKHCQ